MAKGEHTKTGRKCRCEVSVIINLFNINFSLFLCYLKTYIEKKGLKKFRLAYNRDSTLIVFSSFISKAPNLLLSTQEYKWTFDHQSKARGPWA